jgi:hypothetical protein
MTSPRPARSTKRSITAGGWIFPALNEGKSGGGVVTNNAAEGILNEDPYDIKVAIGYMNNFAFSCGPAGTLGAGPVQDPLSGPHHHQRLGVFLVCRHPAAQHPPSVREMGLRQGPWQRPSPCIPDAADHQAGRRL